MTLKLTLARIVAVVLFAWNYGALALLLMSRYGRRSSSRRFSAPGIGPRTARGPTLHLATRGSTAMTRRTAVVMGEETEQQVRDTLAAELAKAEADHPGWRCWLSSELHPYATRLYKGRCAVTLDAASPSLLGLAIDAWVSEGEPRRLAGLDE